VVWLGGQIERSDGLTWATCITTDLMTQYLDSHVCVCGTMFQQPPGEGVLMASSAGGPEGVAPPPPLDTTASFEEPSNHGSSSDDATPVGYLGLTSQAHA
jgi:hypothetical protein